MYNALFDGLVLASVETSNVVDDLADKVFHWKDPKDIGQEISFWIEAAISAAASAVVPFVGNVWRVPGIVSGGAFAVAAAQQTTQELGPVSGLTRNKGLEELHDMIANFTIRASAAIETWSNETFSQQGASQGNSILDYLSQGRFVSASAIPGKTEVAQFFKSLLVARMFNMIWRAEPIYVISTTVNITDVDPLFPNDNSYYDPLTGRTYVTRYFHGSKQMPPPNMDLLNGELYGIHSYQVAQSSGRAWEIGGGNNYTNEMDLSNILNSNDSCSGSNPWIDQAGYPGVFRLPVCDVGNSVVWISAYDPHQLPCCCGPNCSQTGDFMKAANLQHNKKWRKMCKKQLKGSSINFKDIDFGNHKGHKDH